MSPVLLQRVESSRPVLSGRIKQITTRENRKFVKEFIAKTNMISSVSKPKLHRDKSAPNIQIKKSQDERTFKETLVKRRVSPKKINKNLPNELKAFKMTNDKIKTSHVIELTFKAIPTL